MAEPQRLDQQYAKAMKNHPYGIALYTPLRLSLFNPGTIGYFNDNQEWNPIGHLENVERLIQKGLTPMEEKPDKAPIENGVKWGPMTSRNMKGTKVDVSVGVAPAPGIPITVSAVYAFTVEKDTGALLLTDHPITHEHYYHTTPFKRWCKNNALQLIQNSTWGADVKKHGLWIITSTYATKRCAINMWNNRGRAFKVGFGAEAEGLLRGGPNADWYYSHMDEGWTEHTAEEDDQSVVFFGGVEFQYRFVGLGKDLKHVHHPVFRGSCGGDIDNVIGLAEYITEVPDTTEGSDGGGLFLIESRTYLADEDEDFLDIWHGD